MAAQWAQHAVHNASTFINHAQAALQPFAAVAFTRVNAPPQGALGKVICPPGMRGGGTAGSSGSSGSSLFSNSNGSDSMFAVTSIGPTSLSHRRSGGSGGGVLGSSSGALALRRLFPQAAAAHLHTSAQPGVLSGDVTFRQSSPYTTAVPASQFYDLPSSGFATPLQSGDEVANDSDGTREEDAHMLAQQETRSQGYVSGSASAGTNMRISAPMRSSMDPISRIGRSLGVPSLKPPQLHRRPARIIPESTAAALSMPADAAILGFTGTDAENAQAQAALNLQHAEEEDAMLAEAAMARGEEYTPPSRAATAAAAISAAQSSITTSSSSVSLADDELMAPQVSPADIVKFFMEATNPSTATPKLSGKARLLTLPHDPSLFFASRDRSLASHNELIRVCAAKGLYAQGVDVLREQMRPRGLEPDEHTYVALLGLCKAPNPTEEEKVERMSFAMELLNEYKSRFSGRITESFFNALTDVAARLDSLDRAEDIIKLMRQHGVQPSQVTYTELIHACRRVGTPAAIERGVKFFEHMQQAASGAVGSPLEPDVQTYNAMLRMAGLSSKGTAYAVKLFEEMKEKHYQPTIYTYSNLIYACAKSPHHYAQAFEYFAAALAQGFKADLQLYNILLHACATGGKGDLANAMHLFRLMEQQGVGRDTVSYNSMLNVLAESQARGDRVPIVMAPADGSPIPEADMVDKGKRIEMAQALLVQMEQTAVPITLQTVNCAVKVSARALRLNNTPKMQADLLAAHGFQPNFYSHKMLVEMYTSANRLDRALERVQAMRDAGHTAPRALYRDMLKKVSKPKKSMEAREAETYGQQILRHMKADGHTPRPEDERLFDAHVYGAYLHEQRAAALARDTVKSGPLHSFSQRADAMLRPGDKRTGSARTGHQTERLASNPTLAKHKAKRGQRAADAKDKAQGLNPAKRREQAILDGHHYD